MTTKLTTRKEVNQVVDDIKKQSLTTVFVPTMGALHEGHLKLVEYAKSLADRVWVSVYVNPTQFGPNEDFAKYPRVLEEDLEKLKKLQVDYLFTPQGDSEVYAEGFQLIKANPELAQCLCGLSRPGHFDGVCSVVKILFELIKPDYAIFGEKDYQQLLVIKDMVETQEIRVEIVSYPVVREDSGLAMSSRNKYLSDLGKEKASEIYKTLSAIKNKEYDTFEGTKKLATLGFQVEYLETRWQRLLFAGKLEATRLIDNLSVV